MSRNPYAEHQPTGGSGSYLKFEDGKTLTLKLMSDPVIFDSVYDQPGVPRTVSTKYAFIVYNLNDKEVQIMQLPKTGYRALAAIAADADYGNPMENDYLIKITRTGQKQQTKYSVVPLMKKVAIPEEIQEEVEDLDLIERLNNSPNAERAAWLFDEIDGKRPKADPNAAAAQKDDVIIEDITDEPINLDDIPL